ncbi:FkbM family methyltransferase [Allorhizobium terrae]|uniref:FkbM family methyltransferase n=1 Tax=Allorhizobium terrae TaxID=1848972 RepID=A0A4S4A2G3_9HYPH|nr:FkbM family methyltransferase [Allorhizobium terrae]THF52551.1 FkbM family methyltransferase [Allorhizobium terrae]TWD46992.1 FkbM family methyltransferase [Agrobacterium vitis]
MLKTAIRAILPEQVYDTLRRAKQNFMTRRFSSYVSEHNYGGHRLKVLIADPIGAEWYDHDESAMPEIDELKRFELTGKTIFDLGAHQCVIAMLLAELTGKTGQVIAVEANAHNHKVSLQNLATNQFDNVTCVHGLVSSGKLDIAIDGGLNGRARRADSTTPKLKVLTIDEMTRRYGAPALVLLDIEGHEIEALSAATETLKDPHCHWLVELHGDADLADYGHKNSDIFKFFPTTLFKPVILDTKAGRFVPFMPEDLPHERCHIVFERIA